MVFRRRLRPRGNIRRRRVRRARVGYSRVRYNMSRVSRFGRARVRKANSLNFLKLKKSFQLSCPPDTANTNQASVPLAGQYWMADLSCSALAANTAGQNKFNYATYNILFNAGTPPDITAWSGLYDQYRITGIKVTFKYMTGTSPDNSTQITNQQPYCQFAVVTDFDNPGAAFTASDTDWQLLNERPNVKRATFPNKKNSLSIYFKLKTIAKSIYDQAGTYTGVETQYGKWLDGATAQNALYLGLQWMIQANPDLTTTKHMFRIYTTFYYQFRNRVK